MFILTEENSMANVFLAELRDVKTQRDTMRFRRNLERLGEILAYEISKTLPYRSAKINTPLKKSATFLPEIYPVLISVMRAGLPFHQGFLNIFDKSDCGFIGAYRAPHTDAASVKIEMDYVATPDMEGKTICVVDPMLATGKSLVKSIEALLHYGKPKKIFIATVIASPEGVQYLNDNLTIPYELYTAALDEGLDENAYIVPGLGDAGDLSYGQKQ